MAVNVHEAKTHFSRLLDRVVAGEEIIIARHGKPLARLTAIKKPSGLRKLGGMKGKIWIADDFDAPLPRKILAAFRGDV